MSNPNGRPSKFDETTAKLIAMNYAQGLPLRVAAQAAGISHATAKAWVKESRENPTGPKGTFWPLMREARAKAIGQAAQASRKTDPKWWLARMLPKEFGDPARKLEVDIGVKSTAEAVKLARDLLTNDQAREHLEAAARSLLGDVAGQSGDVRAPTGSGTVEK